MMLDERLRHMPTGRASLLTPWPSPGSNQSEVVYQAAELSVTSCRWLAHCGGSDLRSGGAEHRLELYTIAFATSAANWRPTK